MANVKIACIGSGSLYFRRVLADVPLAEDLSGSEIVLYDIDSEKSALMAELGIRLAKEAGTDIKVRSTDSLDDAVDGADFALASIGGSGAEIAKKVYDSYFHYTDIQIPAKYGVHQVIGDTCGPAGMMMAFRTIPAYINICKVMEKRCPAVVFFNHSNPMAVLMRTLHKYTSINSYGVCHGVQGGITRASKILEIPAEELECKWVGTNHYYWFTKITHKRKDMLAELMKRMKELTPPESEEMSWELSNIYGYRIAYPIDDHTIEFYPFLSNNKNRNLPYALEKIAKKYGYDVLSAPMPSAEHPSPEVREGFFKEYQKILDEVTLPKEKVNSITGEGMANILSSIANAKRHICILNTANNGAIINLPYAAEVELECVTDSCGVRPLLMGEAPPVLKGMLEKRFAWQELVADAGVKGDRNLALQAMILDEMAIWPQDTKAMLDELLNASKALLPQFDF